MKRMKLAGDARVELRRAPVALDYDHRRREHVSVPCEVILWTGPERPVTHIDGSIVCALGQSFGGQSWRECFAKMRYHVARVREERMLRNARAGAA
jgi:hypothetical protein